ncbi:MAG: hypothetical protein GY852_07295, partial [bacterium]|nr:hypothetical protein [bacterium]
MKNALHIKWVGPFLTVPILFIASMFVEAWFQESGITAYIPVGKRSIYSLWRIVMLTSLVATPLATLFLADSWKRARKTALSFRDDFFNSVFPMFVLTLLAMTTGAFGILSPLGVSSSMIAQLLLTRCVFAAIWSISAATLCSSITSGSGGAVLSLGLFSLALVPGLSGASLSWWFIAPLGDMVTSVDSLSTGWDATFA